MPWIQGSNGITWSNGSAPSSTSNTSGWQKDSDGHLFYGSSQSASTETDLTNYDNWNGDYLGYLKYMADHGSPDQYDIFMNSWLSEKSEDRAREWTAQREDTQYQRLVQDLKAAGINPYILLNNGASPVSSSSSGNTYSGSHKANYEHNQNTEAKSWAALLVSLIGTIAFIASVAI